MAAFSMPASAATGEQWQVVMTFPADNAGTLAINEVTNTVYAASFMPTTPVSPEESNLLVIDGGTSVITTRIPTELAPAISTMAVNEAENKLYVPNYGSSSISVVDGATNAIADTIAQPNSMPWGAVFDETTNTVYVTDGNDNDQLPQGAVYVIDGATDAITTTIPIDDGAVNPVVDPDLHKLLVPIEGDDYVAVIDTTTNTLESGIYLGEGSAPQGIALDPGLHRAYVRGNDGITVIDTVAEEVVGDPIPLGLPAGETLLTVAVDPARHLVYAGTDLPDESGGRVYELHGETGDVVRTVDIPGAGLNDVRVNSTTNTMYVTAEVEDPNNFLGFSSVITVLHLVAPAPTPTPTPTPEVPVTPDVPATPAVRPTLAATGSDPHLAVPIGGGVSLLLLGAAALSARRWRIDRG